MSKSQLTIVTTNSPSARNSLSQIELFRQNMYVYRDSLLVNLLDVYESVVDTMFDEYDDVSKIPDNKYENLLNLIPNTKYGDEILLKDYYLLRPYFQNQTILEELSAISTQLKNSLALYSSKKWQDTYEFEYAWIFYDSKFEVAYYQFGADKSCVISNNQLKTLHEPIPTWTLRTLNLQPKEATNYVPFTKSFDWDKYKLNL